VRARRWLFTALGILAASLVLVAGRGPLLRAAGGLLVVDEPLRAADAIVIAINAGGSGVLEAADLVHSGIAQRVALFADPIEAADLEFARRGIEYESEVARKTRLLRALGVANIEQIPASVSGTGDEGRILPDWCERRRLHSIVVVSTADHTRRLRRVLNRAFKGRETRAIVRRARFSEFDPDHWWSTRGGVRVEIVEFEKLMLDFLRHPF
jgi:hypothetical protein